MFGVVVFLILCFSAEDLPCMCCSIAVPSDRQNIIPLVSYFESQRYLRRGYIGLNLSFIQSIV